MQQQTQLLSVHDKKRVSGANNMASSRVPGQLSSPRSLGGYVPAPSADTLLGTTDRLKRVTFHRAATLGPLGDRFSPRTCRSVCSMDRLKRVTFHREATLRPPGAHFSPHARRSIRPTDRKDRHAILATLRPPGGRVSPLSRRSVRSTDRSKRVTFHRAATLGLPGGRFALLSRRSIRSTGVLFP